MNAIILHGTGDRNDGFWFPYVKNILENKGYDVWSPQMPNSEEPNLQDWLPFVLNNGKITEDTILIGHSKGAGLILSILENINIQVKQCILVSSYAQPLKASPGAPDSGAEFDWNKIRNKSKQITFINSDNDPWGCDDEQGRIMLNHLGGVLIIPHGEGHMGSTAHNQPYKEFPLLVKQLDI
jgi:hypothetical protein